MSLLDRIENLRQKPESYRQRVAFLLTLFITSVIFIGWIFSLWLSVNNYRMPETVTDSLAEIRSTFDQGVERIFLGGRMVKNQIGDLIKMIPIDD